MLIWCCCSCALLFFLQLILYSICEQLSTSIMYIINKQDMNNVLSQKDSCSKLCVKIVCVRVCVCVFVQNEIKFDMIQHEESVMLNSRAKKIATILQIYARHGCVHIFFFLQSNHAVRLFSLLKRVNKEYTGF